MNRFSLVDQIEHLLQDYVENDDLRLEAAEELTDMLDDRGIVRLTED